LLCSDDVIFDLPQFRSELASQKTKNGQFKFKIQINIRKKQSNNNQKLQVFRFDRIVHTQKKVIKKRIKKRFITEEN
jgi:hypothetical protein